MSMQGKSGDMEQLSPGPVFGMGSTDSAARVTPRKRGVLSKLLVAITATALAMIAVFGLVLYWLFSNGFTRSEPAITATTIINHFDEIAELGVAQYNFGGVGKFSAANLQVLGWDVPFTGKSFLVTYEGEVKAGLHDVKDVEVRFNDADKQVALLVPEPQVLSATIDPGSIEQYDQSFNPMNQITVQDIADFLETETARNRQEAASAGLLDQAKERLEHLLTSQLEAMLFGTKYEDYAITLHWRSTK
ncbi:DUF4230 domain-containing protein [Trueperella pecoris]|uniref:DUF4230 domain-containing protein n=1 Tax=Trueperella pecoris TaxID=2733571 RepID=A0A7M1QYQ8_9ACTO|nr:DUF4230 domain-containing protein [Trueperella pecoris]QOR47023.1 DUF4230 domain-containing protein [Trueperella pecoris]